MNKAQDRFAIPYELLSNQHIELETRVLLLMHAFISLPNGLHFRMKDICCILGEPADGKGRERVKDARKRILAKGLIDSKFTGMGRQKAYWPVVGIIESDALTALSEKKPAFIITQYGEAKQVEQNLRALAADKFSPPDVYVVGAEGIVDEDMAGNWADLEWLMESECGHLWRDDPETFRAAWESWKHRAGENKATRSITDLNLRLQTILLGVAVTQKRRGWSRTQVKSSLSGYIAACIRNHGEDSREYTVEHSLVKADMESLKAARVATVTEIFKSLTVELHDVVDDIVEEVIG